MHSISRGKKYSIVRQKGPTLYAGMWRLDEGALHDTKGVYIQLVLIKDKCRACVTEMHAPK